MSRSDLFRVNVWSQTMPRNFRMARIVARRLFDSDHAVRRDLLVTVEPIPDMRLADPRILLKRSNTSRKLGLRSADLDCFLKCLERVFFPHFRHRIQHLFSHRQLLLLDRTKKRG